MALFISSVNNITMQLYRRNNTMSQISDQLDTSTDPKKTSGVIPSFPLDMPYVVVKKVLSNSRISDNIAAGELIFTPLGIYFIAGYFTLIPGDVPKDIKGYFLILIVFG